MTQTDSDPEHQPPRDATVGSACGYLPSLEPVNGYSLAYFPVRYENDLGYRRRPTNEVDLRQDTPCEGFTVLEAEGSPEALKILAIRQEPIDLLLTDLMLPPPGFQLTSTKNPYPRVHGHDIIQRALATKKTSRVILMSSLSYHERKAYQTVTDLIPFLQKPFSVETLLQLVHEVLASAPLSYDDSATEGIAKQAVRWHD